MKTLQNNTKNESKNAANVASFNYNNTAFKMSASFQGFKYGAFGDNLTHPHFIVSIRTENGERTRFNFYASYNDYKNNKQTLNREDLKGALECFLSDGSCYEGARDFEDFCSKLGYTKMEDYKRARHAFDGCKRHHEAAARLFGSDYSNILTEMYDEE